MELMTAKNPVQGWFLYLQSIHRRCLQPTLKVLLSRVRTARGKSCKIDKHLLELYTALCITVIIIPSDENHSSRTELLQTQTMLPICHSRPI